MATSDKLTYLNTTKGLIKDAINNAGANITNDTFRSYATTLGTVVSKMRTDRDTLVGNGVVGTSTGSISGALNYPLNEMKMTKESTQDGTPTPESPQEVKTVKGYRNLFDKTAITTGHYYNDSGQYNSADTVFLTDYIKCLSDSKYLYQTAGVGSTKVRINFFNSSKTWLSQTAVDFLGTYTFTTPNNAEYIRLSFGTVVDTDYIQIIEGETSLPYIPYGSNYIYTTITDGTNIKNIPLPLNNNEIAGIGDYKDEYIVDKNGHCWLNKLFGKRILNGTENWVLSSSGNLQDVTRFNLYGVFSKNTSRQLCSHNKYLNNLTANSEHFYIYGNQLYFFINNSLATTLEQFKTWLSNQYNNGNPVIVYYELTTEELIDLQTIVDLTLYSGTNTITNSEDMDMAIKYVEDINTILATLFTPESEE